MTRGKSNVFLPFITKEGLEQAWANYGPGATCGMLNVLIRPAKLEKMYKLTLLMFYFPCNSDASSL